MTGSKASKSLVLDNIFSDVRPSKIIPTFFAQLVAEINYQCKDILGTAHETNFPENGPSFEVITENSWPNLAGVCG